MSDQEVDQASTENDGLRIRSWHALAVVVVILLLWALNWFFASKYLTDGNAQGQFGDQFGAVNALFSGLAFAGIIYSLFLQRHDLNLQREEMQKSRQEFEKQNFNDVFFSLLKQQRDLMVGASASVRLHLWDTNHLQESRDLNGITLFEYLKEQQKVLIETISAISRPIKFDPSTLNSGQLEDLEQRQFNINREKHKGVFDYYNFFQKGFFKIEQDNPIQRSRLAYAYLFVKHHNALSSYFRHMYYILVFIKQQKDEEIKSHSVSDVIKTAAINKKYNAYAGYLQAQMSPAELYLTFYNGLNFPKLQALLIEFNLLENLDEEELLGIKSGDIEGMVFRSRRNLIEAALNVNS